jgi:uncharacterized protein YdaU (DUF1376 family)
MSGYPSLPLFVKEYIVDTLHLNLLESGAYLHLLMQSWATSDCSIPDDDKKLAAYVKLSFEEWMAIKPEIEPFFIIKNNRWINPRLKKEFEYVKRKTLARKKAGQKGGIAKSLKTKENKSSNATNLLEQNPSNTLAPTPTPTPIKKIYKKEMFDVFWKVYPRKVSKPKAEELYKKLINNETATHEQIIKGLNNYLADLKTKDWLNPAHPTTWLNAGRWEDVYDDKIIREDRARDLRISSNPQGTGESLAVQQLRAQTCNR